MDSATITSSEEAAQLRKLVNLQQEEIGHLREQLRLLKSKMFGPKTDFLPGLDQQLSMFEDGPTAEPSPEEEPDEVKGYKRKKPGRKPIPEDLPREHVYHDIPEAEKACGCGSKQVQIGEETSEQVDFIPAQLKVICHHRSKWACPICEGVDTPGKTVKIAPAPKQLIAKSFATPGLLAQVITAKFVDSMPFYRQEQQFERLGLPLGRATMCNWAALMGQRCEILTDMLLDKAKQGNYLQCDETTVQVMKEPGRKNTSKSYMWVIRGGPPDRPIVLFHYDPSRSQEVAKKLLSRFQGYVQTDGYQGYNFLEHQEGVTLLACMAHAQRKFADVCKASGKKAKKGLAGEGLQFFKKLYRLEADWRESQLRSNQIRDLRQEKAIPILNAFKEWLDSYHGKVPPKSLLGKAIGYTLNLWPRLTRFTEQGFLHIDNNRIENNIRPFVIGRRNWLFSGSPEGAKASATLYSLVTTAKANGWDPYQYLRQLFEGLLTAESDQDYDALLPFQDSKAL